MGLTLKIKEVVTQYILDTSLQWTNLSVIRVWRLIASVFLESVWTSCYYLVLAGIRGIILSIKGKK